jgi:hypothetical protein
LQIPQPTPVVAQIVNLPYRRLAVGSASAESSASQLSRGSRITNPRYGMLPACATKLPPTAAPVAQIANLPYRRLAVGAASATT